jgi:prevent-host-death family protein
MPPVTIVNGQLKANLGNAKIYTMRELNQRTAQVVEEVNQSGVPAIVTKHGRFVALIMPLQDAHIETMVLSEGPIAQEVDRRAVDPDSATYSLQEMLDEVAADNDEGEDRHTR